MAEQTPITNVPSTRNSSPVGKWAGQMQFQEYENAQLIQAAHSVVLLTAEFSPDGKMTGSSRDNGCQMLGLWSPGPGPAAYWIDVTFSNCGYSNMNRRFHGAFILARPNSSGGLQLNSIGAPLSIDMAKSFDV